MLPIHNVLSKEYYVHKIVNLQSQRLIESLSKLLSKAKLTKDKLKMLNNRKLLQITNQFTRGIQTVYVSGQILPHRFFCKSAYSTNDLQA